MPETTRSSYMRRYSWKIASIRPIEACTIGIMTTPSTCGGMKMSLSRIGEPEGPEPRLANRDRVRKQAHRDAPAVERQDRQQVQDHEHDVDGDSGFGHEAHRQGKHALRKEPPGFHPNS